MIKIDTALNYMYDLKNRGVVYSMDYSRTGYDGTADCSGAVYQALRNAGASNAGWVLNTDSLHDWLIKNGFTLVAHNKEIKPTKGMVFILGKKGASGGAYGHTGFFNGDRENIIHCNYSANGVSIDDFDTMYNRSVAVTPQLKDWYFYAPPKTNVYTGFKVGDKVKLMTYATHYQTGQKIASFAKGKTYKILQVKNVNQSNSKRAYLLEGIMSWVLEQDVG